jgi:hypothetical protein
MNRQKNVMKSKTIIGLIATLAILSGVTIISFSNNNGGWVSTPTSSLTKSVTPTITSSPTLTLLPISSGTKTYTPTSSPTFTPGVTHTPSSTPTATFIVVCTPPPCAIGTIETYFCPGVCLGGCNTTCATYTPTQ